MPDIPIFLMASAYSRGELMDQAQALRIDEILTKPVSPSTLLDAMLSLFGKVITQRPRKHQRAETSRNDEWAVRGAYVLLVDDNEINQEVAREILEAASIHVDVANNGEHALQKVGQNDYDAVLMDCQMPVMDGYEATRRLRADPRFSSLPVIAMTANAMVGDKEKCLEAGMNDFIAKPIDVEQLFFVLARWVQPTHSNHQGEEAMQPVDLDLSPDALPMVAGLQLESALRRVGGNAKLLRKLLNRFRETQRDAMQRIVIALGAGDREGAMRETHTVKGLAGNMGASALVERAAHLESALKREGQADATHYSAALGAMEHELGSLIAKLDAAMPAVAEYLPDQLTPESVDMQVLARDMVELSHLLKDDDSSAVKYIESLQPRLQALGHGQESQTIRRLVSKYDFDGALATLDALSGELGKTP